MRDLARLRERYLRDDPARRLGNLASDLLRLSTWLRLRRDDQEIADLMRQIAWMIEWNADQATEELVNVQREICSWRRLWPVERARTLLAFRTKQMSNQVLAMSGLVSAADAPR